MSPTCRTTRRQSKRRRLSGAAAVALVAASATACSNEAIDQWSRGGMPEGVTEQSQIIQTLWNGAWIAALATGVVVWGLIFWAVAFHRKKRNSEALPPQVRYNLPIEILYTVVPVIMVAILFFFTARDQTEIMKVSGTAPVKVRVDGYQWSWKFTTHYQGQKVEVAGVPVDLSKQSNENPQGPQLVLPVNTKVEFELHSDDVIHSFWVPAFLFKQDLFPGNVVNRFEIKTLDRTGVFIGRCAELCGADHSRMLFSVKLVPQAEFEQYIKSHAGSAQ
ncbi:cytochrome c oxidase, subunit II [Thermobispora bispora DSM 43833]|uniref:cytochrome-c oxidase n=1 Tax=Thermobispora bispora (strain ATCC 19993 / DSM 43833 / CBS 139.67 / JCM 10125 / KCTC 9307 / NBRC 14880 / R51) TaxID=469371 RepID=D6Y988_THEBD|nr:cytochrome c oxidase, subunit II [Thermobispora bispora DSM 43833]